MKKFLLPLIFLGVAYAEPNLILCDIPFALCAASSAKPTGKNIIINGISFQEGVSVCPVITGKSVGNRDMIKTCGTPKGKNTVWSLFSTVMEYPQAPTWAVVTAVPRTFITTAGAGGMSNQWSYPCVIRPKKVNGATLADCLGPLNESPWHGEVVPIGSTSLTAAPIGAEYPVGTNIPAIRK
tara:strand:+ start:19 stop:564 length:546 start_codon:yes stop_codon:yes gene_type:complete